MPESFESETPKERKERFDQLSVHSGRNQAVYYSGWYNEPPESERGTFRNETLAREYRRACGEDRRILPDTPRGKALDGLWDERRKVRKEEGAASLKMKEDAGQLPTIAELENLQIEGSRAYARRTTGQARSFVVGAEDGWIFRKVEQPTLLEQEELLNNPGVTSINGVLREDLKPLHDYKTHYAFYRIAQAEVERDRRAVKMGRYPGGEDAAHVQERRQRYGETVLASASPEQARHLKLVADHEVMGRSEAHEAIQVVRQELNEAGGRSREQRAERLQVLQQKMHGRHGAGALGHVMHYRPDAAARGRDVPAPLNEEERRSAYALLRRADGRGFDDPERGSEQTQRAGPGERARRNLEPSDEREVLGHGPSRRPELHEKSSVPESSGSSERDSGSSDAASREHGADQDDEDPSA